MRAFGRKVRGRIMERSPVRRLDNAASNFPPEGTHLIADAWGVSKEILDDIDFLKALLQSGVAACGATLLKLEAVQFEPNGVTVAAILAESHASLHTYPDHGILMVDAFTCGPIDPDPLIRTVIEGV